jgi:acetyl-CoA carboxylase biotin carboxylase subunit
MLFILNFDERGDSAPDEMRVEGIKTTIPFHKRLLETDAFVEGTMDTKYVERELLKVT